MLGRLKFELSELANEMLDQLPEAVFKSKTTTFLDPCMGGGQFVREVEQRLRDYGHTDANIAGRVFGVESSELRVNYAVNKYALVGQYFVCQNYLEHDEEMKFDVVIGNPPYQHPTNKSIKLWARFGIKALELSRGHTLMISPSIWLEKPNRRAFELFTQKLSGHLVSAKSNVSYYFPTVGEKIGTWHATTDQSPVFTVDDVTYPNAYEQDMVTLRKEQLLVAKLKEKFLEGTTLREIKVIDFYYSTSHAIKQGLMSEIKSEDYNIPVFITANRIAYTKKEHIRPCYKLILSKSGYYYRPNDESRLMFIPPFKYYGVGENGVGVPCKTIVEAKNARNSTRKKYFGSSSIMRSQVVLIRVY